MVKERFDCRSQKRIVGSGFSGITIKRVKKSLFGVSQGIMAPFSNSVALGPLSLEARKPLKDNFSYVCLTISSPSVYDYEAGGCSKTSLSGLGPGQLNQKYCDLGVCPLRMQCLLCCFQCVLKFSLYQPRSM